MHAVISWARTIRIRKPVQSEQREFVRFSRLEVVCQRVVVIDGIGRKRRSDDPLCLTPWGPTNPKKESELETSMECCLHTARRNAASNDMINSQKTQC